MRTVQESILIKDYTATLEQAMTNPTRTPSYRLILEGKRETKKIDHVVVYFDAEGASKYGKGDVSLGHRVRVFLNYEDYSNCLDLLRNEKPVYFNYSYLLFDDDSNPNSPYNTRPELQYYALSTKKERVGEGES